MSEETSVDKENEVYQLMLTRHQLLHLRDLMSVLIATPTIVTVSQALAITGERQCVESTLWENIAALCVEAKLATGANAPDYVVSLAAPPTLGVFEVDSEGSGNEEEENENEEEDDGTVQA